ncbi:MAG: maleylpyruvate isomerase N-terminal domain-containing protein [Actinomycetota bacterium]|nr:maleylpyruvate isomerase N-terminal domain-containing protein [Actinomycetota bacterium]
MDLDGDRWRGIFESAASVFAEVVGSVDPARLGDPALGSWTVQDLVGHTSRSLLTIEMYLAREPEPVTLEGPLAYLAAAAAAGTDPAAADAIAQRGRDAGKALGDDVADAVRAISERVASLVDRTADDAPCATPLGSLTLAAYLPTRVLELTVHTLDLAAATGEEVPEELDEPVAACLELVAAAVGETAHAAAVLRALTGRGSLPDGLRVV